MNFKSCCSIVVVGLENGNCMQNSSSSWGSYGSFHILMPSQRNYFISFPLCHWQNATHNHFLSRVHEVWIQSFPSSRWVAVSKLKSLVCPPVHPLLEGENIESGLIRAFGIQTAISRISYKNNYYVVCMCPWATGEILV